MAGRRKKRWDKRKPCKRPKKSKRADRRRSCSPKVRRRSSARRRSPRKSRAAGVGTIRVSKSGQRWRKTARGGWKKA